VKFWQSVAFVEPIYQPNQKSQQMVSALFVVRSWQSKNNLKMRAHAYLHTRFYAHFLVIFTSRKITRPLRARDQCSYKVSNQQAGAWFGYCFNQSFPHSLYLFSWCMPVGDD